MKAIISILFLIIGAATAFAQNDSLTALYHTAESKYAIGRVDEALEILEKNAAKFPPSLKTNVLKLSALCSIALDEEQKAIHYTSALLHEYPGYTPLDAPQRYKDLVYELKKGLGTSFSTASAGSEKIEETPVPVTLITEEMIKACGAQTVRDALVAYVPGISVVENNGITNFAYRGIYGASQDQMLIMLNGTRLNSYCSNLGHVDYSISIEKIKQIEVLRGPASSLYGDVALTGVVNIITKDGNDIDGVVVNAAAGNYGQAHGGVLFGKRIIDIDISAWTSIYRSDGQTVYGADRVSTSDGDQYPDNITIGGFNRKPSYDFGTSIKYKDFSLTYTSLSSKAVTPYTEQSDHFIPYSYWKYSNLFDIKPGASYTMHIIKAGYNKDFGKWAFSASVEYNKEKTAQYFVIADSTQYYNDYIIIPTMNFDPENFEFSYIDTYHGSGLTTYDEWGNNNYTASARFSYKYGSQSNGGTIIAGTDASIFRLLYQNELRTYDYKTVYPPVSNTWKTLEDKETKNDAFLQWKHRLGRLIINSGVRFDHKRHGKITIDTALIHDMFSEGDFFNKRVDKIDSLNSHDKSEVVSPRISLIYLLDRLNFKLNYSKSFVDAPFFYRTDANMLLYFNKYLSPETANSFQLTVSGKNFVKNLATEINFFYNNYDKLITKYSGIYVNWDVSIAGMEAVASYNYNRLSLNAYLATMKVVKHKSVQFSILEMYEAMGIEDLITENTKIIFEPHEVENNHINCVPNFTANATISYNLLKCLRLNANFSYIGRQYACIDQDENKFEELPQVFLVNPSANITIGKHLEFYINVHNIFNHKYYLGGRSTNPVRQKGLWLMAGASYKF